MKRWFRAATLALVLAMGLAVSAAADSNFHTQRIPLMPVDDAPLRSGFVIDIHANGPRVFAHERYVLNGAMPNTTYQVALEVFAESTTCATNIATVNTAILRTNTVGNGTAEAFFRPEEVPHNVTVGIAWEFTSDGGVAYQTACTEVTTD